MNAFVLAVLAVGLSQAISIKWTGYANNNQWTTNTNWYPDSVPGPNDDVTIESGVVLVTIPTGVNSLTMGTTFNQPANLTLFQDFFIGTGGMFVEENGNLFINAGQAAVTGVINIDGNFYFESGIVSGQISVSKKGAAYLNAAGAKIFSGCNFACQGPAALGDVLMLNQSSVVTLSGATTASGIFSVQATDSSAVLFDVSSGSFDYSAGTFSVQAPTNFGTLTLTNGNLTLYNTVQFTKAVTIPATLSINTVGSAIVSFGAGVSGAGFLNAAGSSLEISSASLTGYLNVVGGNVTIVVASSIGTVSLAGGHLFGKAALTVSQLNLLSGILSGSGGVMTTNLYLKGRGTVLDGSVSVSGAGWIGSATLLTYTKNGLFTVTTTGSFTIPTSASLVINGAVGAGGFVNNGVVKAGGIFQTQNINVGGAGTFNASATVRASSATFTASTINLVGAGSFKGTNSMITVGTITGYGTGVAGTIGVYTFQCPVKCNSIATSATPTSAFAFSVVPATSQH